MATICKRVLEGNLVVWQAKVRIKGYPKQSKVFLSHSDARAWASTVESEMARGVFVSRAEAKRTIFRDALARYEREITPDKKSADDERSKINRLRESQLADYSLANLNGTVLAAWRDSRLQTVKPGTVVRELALISHVFTVARKEWGMAGLSNPVEDIRKPSLKGSGRTRRLEPGEEKELLSRANTYGKPWPTVIRLAIETAMRREEIALLRWKHVDLKRRVIHLIDSKNGEPRDVPLSSRAIDVLRALPRRKDGLVFGLRPDSITQAFSRITGNAAKSKRTLKKPKKGLLGDLHFHDLRHEATSRLFERGLNQIQVAAITGHKTLQVLKGYTHLRAEELAHLLA